MMTSNNNNGGGHQLLPKKKKKKRSRHGGVADGYFATSKENTQQDGGSDSGRSTPNVTDSEPEFEEQQSQQYQQHRQHHHHHHQQHYSSKHKRRKEDNDGSHDIEDNNNNLTSVTLVNTGATSLTPVIIACLERLQATERLLTPSTKATQQDREEIVRAVQRWRHHAKNTHALEENLFQLMIEHYPRNDQKVLLDEAIALFLLMYPNEVEVVLEPISRCLSTSHPQPSSSSSSDSTSVNHLLRYNKKAPPFYGIFNLFSNLESEADFEASLARTSCKQILVFFAEKLQQQQQSTSSLPQQTKTWFLDCLFESPKQLKKHYALYLLEQCYTTSIISEQYLPRGHEHHIADKRRRIESIAAHLTDLIQIELTQQRQKASGSGSTLAHVWAPTIIIFAHKQRLLGRRFPLFPFSNIISSYFRFLSLSVGWTSCINYPL